MIKKTKTNFDQTLLMFFNYFLIVFCTLSKMYNPSDSTNSSEEPSGSLQTTPNNPEKPIDRIYKKSKRQRKEGRSTPPTDKQRANLKEASKKYQEKLLQQLKKEEDPGKDKEGENELKSCESSSTSHKSITLSCEDISEDEGKND